MWRIERAPWAYVSFITIVNKFIFSKELVKDYCDLCLVNEIGHEVYVGVAGSGDYNIRW